MCSGFGSFYHRVISGIAWVEARVMHSDGLTKRKVTRELVHELMKGVYLLRHPLKTWSSRMRREMADLLGQ